MMQRKVMIACAVTGSADTPAPNLPHPKEVANHLRSFGGQ